MNKGQGEEVKDGGIEFLDGSGKPEGWRPRVELHDPMKVRVHGSYPYDERDKWKRVKDLTWQEAAKLIGIEEDTVVVRRQDRDVYLWLNKGFIVIGLPKEEGMSALPMAMLEMVGRSQHKAIEPGMKAVYLHDGNYSLLERVA